MSRTIDVSDPSKLTEDDIQYLQDRDKLPEGVSPLPVAGVTTPYAPEGEYLGHEPTIAPQGGSSIPTPGSAPADPAGDAPSSYEDMTVKELKAEVDARNEDRPEDSKLKKPSKHAELVSVLTEDDEADPELDES